MNAPILCYHRIADLPPGDPLRPVSVTPRAFARQIANLAARGYRTLDLAEAVAAPSADPKCVILTFDDGYPEHCDLVFPLLAQYGFRATFFVVSGWLGDRSSHAPSPALPLSCISEMSRGRMAFGSHGRTHRRLAGLDPSLVWDEVAGSKEDLERALGMPIRAFAYPYGVFDRHAQEAAGACGYEVAVAVNNGADHPLALRRIVVEVSDNPLSLAWKMWSWPVRLRARWRKTLLRRIIRRGRDNA